MPKQFKDQDNRQISKREISPLLVKAKRLNLSKKDVEIMLARSEYVRNLLAEGIEPNPGPRVSVQFDIKPKEAAKKRMVSKGIEVKYQPPKDLHNLPKAKQTRADFESQALEEVSKGESAVKAVRSEEIQQQIKQLAGSVVQSELHPSNPFYVPPPSLESYFVPVDVSLSDLSLYWDESTKRGLTYSEFYNLSRNQKAAVSKAAIVAAKKIVSPFAPKPHRWSAQEFSDYLIENKTETLSGKKLIKLPIIVPAPEEISHVVGMQYVEGADPILDLFVNVNRQERPAHFNPNFQLVGVEEDLFPLMETLILAAPGKISEDVSSFRDDLAIRANETFFGNGSIEGQIGRFKACMEVYVKAKAAKQNLAFPDYATWKQVMNVAYPLNKVPVKLDKTPTEVIRENEDQVTLTRIEYGAGDGPIFGQEIKRGQVIPQSFLLSDWMFIQAQEIGFKELISKHLWTILAFIKPKAECYERSDYLKKTRNIFNYSSCSQNPAQIILKPTHSGAPTFVDNPSIQHIVGLNLWGGGLQKLIDAMDMVYRMTGEVLIAYSDNVYYVHKDTWYSIDGSKMEACINPTNIKHLMMRSLESFESFDDVWQQYAAIFAPTLATNFVGVLGNQEIPIPFMGSGFQGTAYANTEKMLFGFHHYRTKGVKGIDALIKALEETGISAKIEKQTPWNLVVDSGADVVVPLDLLGFDLVRPAFTRQAIPLLNYNRFLQSMLYMRALLKGDIKGNTGEIQAKRLFRLRAEYALAGWFYPGAPETIRTWTGRILKVGRVDAMIPPSDVEAVVYELFALSPSDPLYQSVAGLLGERSVPDLFTTLKIIGGPKAAQDLFNEALNFPAPVAVTVLPPDLVKDLKLPQDLQVLQSQASETIINPELSKHVKTLRELMPKEVLDSWADVYSSQLAGKIPARQKLKFDVSKPVPDVTHSTMAITQTRPEMELEANKLIRRLVKQREFTIMLTPTETRTGAMPKLVLLKRISNLSRIRFSEITFQYNAAVDAGQIRIKITTEPKEVTDLYPIVFGKQRKDKEKKVTNPFEQSSS